MVDPSAPVAPSPPYPVERRGMDGAVITYINQLFQQFMEAHSRVHDDFVAHHEREHGLTSASHEDAKAVTARRLEEIMQSIRMYYDSMLEERDRRYEERFQASQTAITAAFDAREKALVEAFEAREKALQAALDSKDKAVQAAFDSAEKAIAKAELSIEKRADATYVSLAELQRNLGALMPRAEAEQRFSTFDAISQDVRDRLKGIESIKQGGKEALSNMQMLLGIVVALIIIGGFVFAAQTCGG